MSAWAIAFFVLLAWHVVAMAVPARLIYWQHRHIDALKEAARLDEMALALDRAHWWNEGAKHERRRNTP